MRQTRATVTSEEVLGRAPISSIPARIFGRGMSLDGSLGERGGWRRLGYPGASRRTSVNVVLRPEVRYDSTLSTRNPAIFHAADAMECVAVSPSSMGGDNAPLHYLVCPRIVPTDVNGFICKIDFLP
jgi:hypothetical protein